MGNEILYCSVCGTKLLSTDFTRGRAHTVEKRSFCSACMSKPLAAPPPSTKKLRAPRLPSKPGASPVVPVLAVAAAAAVAIGAAVWLASPAQPPSARPASPPSVDPREIAARSAIAAAEAYARTQPLDLAGQSVRWKDAVRAAEGTPLAGEARRESEKAEQLGREAFKRDLARLEEDVGAKLEREEFHAALEAVGQAKRKAAGPEDALALDGRAEAIRTQAKALLPTVLKEAVAAARGVDPAPVKTLRDRIARWGLPELSREVERELSARYYRLPAAWQGTGVGKVDGNPLRLDGGGAWTLYQVWPDDPLKAEHYRPMPWVEKKMWMATSNCHVSAPGAIVVGSKAELHYRGAWDNPAGYKIPALSFQAPELGTYVMEGELELEHWEGNAPVTVRLLKLDRIAKTVQVDRSLRFTDTGQKAPLRLEAQLDRNQELALAVSATTYHVSGRLWVRGLTVHRRTE